MRFGLWIPLALFAILAILFFFTLRAHQEGTIQREQIPSALIDRPAPTSPLPNLQPNQPEVSINTFPHQMRLVNFFASWCTPCRAEMPLLAEIASEITLIGIAYKDRTEDTKKFLSRFGNPYHAIGVDLTGSHAITWGLYGVPETYLIDGKGNVLYRHAGVLTRTLIDQQLRPIWQAQK